MQTSVAFAGASDDFKSDILIGRGFDGGNSVPLSARIMSLTAFAWCFALTTSVWATVITGSTNMSIVTVM